MMSTSKLLLALVFAFFVGADARAQKMDGGRFQPDSNNYELTSTPNSTVPDPSGWNNHGKVTRFATRLEGDHSLDATVIAEQVFARFTLYEVHLEFASGAEQTFAIAAPPGGLQPELRDMSGDSVPNDLVLTSSLLHKPLIVLVNDGHGHLAVPGSPFRLGDDEERASGPNQDHHFLGLQSAGFKSSGLVDDGGLFPPEAGEQSLSSVAPILQNSSPCSSRSERAPPTLVANS